MHRQYLIRDAFTWRFGFYHLGTCMHVGLLGPCFKTGQSWSGNIDVLVKHHLPQNRQRFVEDMEKTTSGIFLDVPPTREPVFLSTFGTNKIRFDPLFRSSLVHNHTEIQSRSNESQSNQVVLVTNTKCTDVDPPTAGKCAHKNHHKANPLVPSREQERIHLSMSPVDRIPLE